MYNKWKIRLFGVVVVLLIISSAYLGYFWYQLNITRNELAESEAKLDTTLAELGDAESELTDTKKSLNNTQAQLIYIEGELGTTKVQLANTEVQLSTTTAELNLTKNKLDITESQLENEKDKNSQMLNQYASLKEQVNNRLGDSPEDKQSFITPNDSSVSEKVLEITGGYAEDVNERWRDYERLYRWVVNNISYSYDSYMPLLPKDISGGLIWRQECWRMPEETLEDKTGDCEDMALLLASMMKSYNKGRYTVWVLDIDSSVSGVSGHIGVAYPVQGGKLTILDPAGNYYTGQYGTLRSESISVAVNSWISYWQTEIPGAKIAAVFSDSIHEEFNDTEEFITWAQDR